MTYYDELGRAMLMLAEYPHTLFVGQGVGCAGTTMTDTLKGVPPELLIEFPVAEDLQMGFCTGLSLRGILPICIFPRWNFMLCAFNQIVNHLDALPLYSEYFPRVIIRVAVPITSPFNPGPQHDGDFTGALIKMVRTVNVAKLEDAGQIMPEYQAALERKRSTVLVEYTAKYGNVVPSGI